MEAASQEYTTELIRLIDSGGVRTVYQPIVDLETFKPVAYEALTRGPKGSLLESPAELFGWAARKGFTPELDLACRTAAISGATEAARDHPFGLFINLEPDGLDGTELFFPAQEAVLAEGSLQIVIELTERALTAKPAELLRCVDELRERGVAIALDDVGVDDRSLALMPFLEPDVIKLDLALVQDSPRRSLARVANAVWAEAERSGALILAEGIETEDHLRRARAVGARYGQGWMFGRPAPLPDAPFASQKSLQPQGRPSRSTEATPFEIVSAVRPVTCGDKLLLLERSLQLESEAFGLAPEGVVLSTFQDAAFFTPKTAARYQKLGSTLAFVGAFGGDMPERPTNCVRGGEIEASETLRGEWNVIVLGSHFAGAFVARDLGDTGADEDRRFDFAMTYDRDLVVQAARSLMQRVARRT